MELVLAFHLYVGSREPALVVRLLTTPWEVGFAYITGLS